MDLYTINHDESIMLEAKISEVNINFAFVRINIFFQQLYSTRTLGAVWSYTTN